MPFQIGERVGDYEVVEILGFGGMGQVYKVRNIISKRVEAMKVLLPNLEGDRQLAERFITEIQVQAQLEHPNIAALHTAQRVDNQLLMIMEFVDGTSLDAVLKNGPLPVARAIDYTRQVLAALAYAHEHGIVHRDIKPANMMLTPAGTIKLMDFGIAKMADRRLTQTGHTLGSLFYMSPEQINDPFNIDGRADLYSVGVSLYEMVTGRRPFAGDSDYQIMCAHLAAAPIPPIEVDPQLPPALSDVILMAISKEREQRFQSAEAFRRALEGVAASIGVAPALAGAAAAAGGFSAPVPQPEPVIAPPPVANPSASPAKPASSSRRGLYVAMGSVATIAVLAVALWQAPRLFKSTAASPNAPPPQTTEQPSVTPQTTPAPAPQPADTGAAAVQPQPVPEQVQPPSTPVPRPVSPGRSAQMQAQPQQSAPRPAAVPMQATPAPPQAQPQPQPVQQQRAEEQQPAKPAVDAAALRESRDTLMMLGTRARTLNTTLQTMRSQQAAMGMNLRGDMVNAQQRMELHLDEAEAALKGGDAESAKKSLSAAEREIERLEKFLGR